MGLPRFGYRSAAISAGIAGASLFLGVARANAQATAPDEQATAKPNEQATAMPDEQATAMPSGPAVLAPRPTRASGNGGEPPNLTYNQKAGRYEAQLDNLVAFIDQDGTVSFKAKNQSKIQLLDPRRLIPERLEKGTPNLVDSIRDGLKGREQKQFKKRERPPVQQSQAAPDPEERCGPGSTCMGGFTTSKPITLAKSKFDLNEALTRAYSSDPFGPEKSKFLARTFHFRLDLTQSYLRGHIKKLAAEQRADVGLVPLMKHIERSDRTPLEKRRIHYWLWMETPLWTCRRQRASGHRRLCRPFVSKRPSGRLHRGRARRICPPPHRAKVRALPLAAVANALNGFRGSGRSLDSATPQAGRYTCPRHHTSQEALAPNWRATLKCLSVHPSRWRPPWLADPLQNTGLEKIVVLREERFLDGPVLEKRHHRIRTCTGRLQDRSCCRCPGLLPPTPLETGKGQ